jgi:hypothetical protein
MKNSQLDYYIAGLIEGDGIIYLPKYYKYIQKYNYNPRLEIAFHRKELPFIKKLKDNLGKVYLFHKTKNNRQTNRRKLCSFYDRNSKFI